MEERKEVNLSFYQEKVDLKKNKYSGLIQAINILKGIHGIGFYEFNKEDVVRHTLVKSIIEAYDEKK